MKIHRQYQKYTCGINLVLVVMVLLAITSCNKDFANKLDLSGKADSISGYKAPKVLYIIIDGARGAAVNAVQAPALTEISENAMQTFNGLSDVSGLAATTWADMLTGVNKAKHKVTQADFSGNNLANFPMFFKQIKQSNPDTRTSAFSSTPAFSQNLISNADLNQNFSNDDAAVKAAMVTELKNEQAGVVLAEFNSVDRAGKQYGYDASVAQYSSAILTVDGYVAEAMRTLRERANFKKENWLVIVASNQGGDFPVPPAQNDGTLFSKPLLNTFAIFYNPRFSYQYYSKPGTSGLPYEGKTVALANDTTANIPAAQSNLYNFGTSGDYTVELKIKVLRFSTGNSNAPILFKTSSPANSTTGWWIIHSGVNGQWRLGGLPSAIMISNQPALKIGVWYTLGFKIYTENNKRWVMIYQDGVKAYANPVDITNRNVNNTEELVAGYRSGYGNTTKQLVTEIKVFNAAVPDNVIAAYSCKGAIDNKHPNYNNLIGYWPATDGFGGFFKDKSPSKNDFVLKNKFEWTAFSDFDSKLCVDLPADIYTRMPNGIDIPSLIYGWMGIKTLNLGLDGKTWVPVYNNLNP
jgi:hypothetical protein